MQIPLSPQEEFSVSQSLCFFLEKENKHSNESLFETHTDLNGQSLKLPSPQTNFAMRLPSGLVEIKNLSPT